MQSTKEQLGHILFETDTPAARYFDIALLGVILVSVLLVILESVTSIRLRYGEALRIAEWIFTIIFTIEYILRIYTAYNRPKYLFSFFGIVDFLAIVPTYLSLFVVGSQYFMVVRALRLLRVFRVFKLARFVGQASVLVRALEASREKITVFIITVLTVVLIIGSVMFLIEGPQNGFTNIPISIYWAIVTLTTVGYGDISPKTPLGQMLASLVMILGYGIIAVPTGIISVELARAEREGRSRSCPNCGHEGHDIDAGYCKRCGEALT